MEWREVDSNTTIFVETAKRLAHRTTNVTREDVPDQAAQAYKALGQPEFGISWDLLSPTVRAYYISLVLYSYGVDVNAGLTFPESD